MLRSLHDDFVATRDALDYSLLTIERYRDRFSRFQAWSPDRPPETDPDSIASIVTSLVLSITFDAVSGTLEALVGDGRLDDIRDYELRGALATWLQQLADLEENEHDVRLGALRVNHAMEPHGGPFFQSIMIEADANLLRRADGAALASMRRDEALMGSARSLHTAHALYLRELRRLRPALDSTLMLIERGIR